MSSFKETAGEFSNSQKALTESTEWVADFQPKLDKMIGQLGTIQALAAEKAISDGNKTLSGEDDDEASPAVEPEIVLSVDDMFSSMGEIWNTLTSIIRDQIGIDTYDGRSIGQMAWRLTDGRRNRPLSAVDAELVENLHSQWKRFTRLYSSREDWLTHEVFSGFMRGAERAEGALRARTS